MTEPTRRARMAATTISAVAVLGLTALAPSAAAATEGATQQSSSDERCITVEVSYWLFGGPVQYVLGPDHCLAETPWTAGIDVEREVEVDPIDSGVGVRVDLKRPPVAPEQQ